MGGDSNEPTPFAFDPFSAAEAACEETVDAILTEGGRLLFESYIERKSFPFASEAVAHVLLSELKMCFVRCDGGEPPQEARGDGRVLEAPAAVACTPEAKQQSPQPPVHDGWALEPEPTRCRIDTWARSCVPVRKKLVRPKAVIAQEQRHRGRAKASSTSNASVGRSPSRAGVASSSEPTEAHAALHKSQMIPLIEEHEEDEEEAVMRDMKEREARRKREEETRLQRKAAEEADEAARLAQVKDQMKNKAFTYDTDGSIIWVQPVKTNKLPNPNPAPVYSFRKDALQADLAGSGRPPLGRGQRNEQRAARKRPENRKEAEFTDSFKKFTAQQPSMLEAMTMAPGVELRERGHRKKGGEAKSPGRSGGPMTRKDYEEMVRGGGGYRRDPADGPATPDGADASPAASPAADLGGGDVSAAEAGRSPSPAAGGEGDAREPLQIAERPQPGLDLAPRPPASPRPALPAAPPSFRRVQMKRDALGLAMSTRERVATGTASRYPNCAPQPPLGATMGHGLAPVGQKSEEYYFPQAAAQNRSTLGADEVSVSPGSAPTSARSTGGQIVSRNPELARRLFPR